MEQIYVHAEKMGGDCRGESCNSSSVEMEGENEEKNLFELFENFYF